MKNLMRECEIALSEARENNDAENASFFEEQIALLTALQAVISSQRSQWTLRNAQECAFEQLENKLMGLGGVKKWLN